MGFSIQIILVLVFSFTLGNALGATPAAALKPGEKPYALKPGEKPLMDPKIIPSDMTPEQAMPKILVTSKYQTSYPDLIQTEADTGLVVAQESEAFRTSRKGLIGDYSKYKGWRKFNLNHHYELADPVDTDETIAKVKDPLFEPIEIEVDLNTALEMDSSEITTNKLNDLIKAGKFKDNAEGRELKRLLDATKGEWEVFGGDNPYSKRKGISKAKLQIFSQPVFGKYDTEEQKAKGQAIKMRAIDHNKEEVYGVIDPKTGERIPIWGYSGGANQTLAPNAVADPKTGVRSPMFRINSLYFFREPNILQNMMDNFDAMTTAFGEGLGIGGVKPVQPVQVLLKGGGSITMYYTYGVMNPNSIWVDMLYDAIASWKEDHKIPLDPADPPKRRHTVILSFYSQQFDMSYRPQLEAEKKFIALNTGAPYEVNIDRQFSVPGGYGFGPVYADFPLDREMGGQLRDFAHVFAKNPNFKISVFFKVVPGVDRSKATSLQIYVLLHSKDQDSEVNIDGVDLFHGQFGSFNRSGHIGISDGQIGNSESRFVVEIPMTNPMAKALIERTRKMMEVQRQEGFLFDGEEFVSMAYVADLTGRLLEEINIDDVRRINKAILAAAKLKDKTEMAKAYGAILAQLQAIYDSKASFGITKTKEQFDADMVKMKSIFVDWYSNRPVPADQKGNGLYVSQFWTLLEHIRQPGEDAIETKQDFDAALWRSWVKADQLKTDISTLWTKAGVTKPLPADRPSQGGGVEEPPAKGKPGEGNVVPIDKPPKRKTNPSNSAGKTPVNGKQARGASSEDCGSELGRVKKTAGKKS